MQVFCLVASPVTELLPVGDFLLNTGIQELVYFSFNLSISVRKVAYLNLLNTYLTT